jgi:TRAP transporter TAXI family solute receptor
MLDPDRSRDPETPIASMSIGRTRSSPLRGPGRLPSGRALAAAVAVASLLAAWVGGYPDVWAQSKVSLVFSSGPTGGSWIPLAGATADLIRRKFPELEVHVEPGAALVNIEKMRTGKADLAWSAPHVVFDARRGRGAWVGKATDRPLHVASFYPNVWQLVVPARSTVRSIRDLKGKPVALPPRGNTSLSEGWELLLRVNGMKLSDLGPKSYGPLSTGTEAMKDGQVAAMGWITAVPASFIQDLGSTMKLRMIPVSDAEFAEIRKINPAFNRHVIPAGAYAEQGIEGDIPTFQAPTILIASATVPADVVYKVTKAVVESRAAFVSVVKSMDGVTAQDMAQSHGMPYHPGARKYYEEAGLLK